MQQQSDSVTPEQLAKLQDDARTILTATGEVPWIKPFFIEFSGTPKSGKSTCIEIVAHFFRRIGFKTLAPTEGASKRTPYYLKDDLVTFNAWSMSYALTHVFDGLYHSDHYQIALLDRGLFDALVWFELLGNREDTSQELRGKQSITSEDRETIQRFILLHKWRSQIDLVLLFKTDPQTSLKREYQDKLIEGRKARAMNPEFLSELNAAYDSARAKYAADFANFDFIDTSQGLSTTPKQTAFLVVERILHLMQRHYNVSSD